MKRGVPKRDAIYSHAYFGKKFFVQLYDSEFSPGMQNSGPAFVKF